MKSMSVGELPIGHATKSGKSRKKRAASSVDLRKWGAVSPIRDQKDCGGSFLVLKQLSTSFRMLVFCHGINNGDFSLPKNWKTS